MKSLNASVLNFIRTYIDIIKKKTIYDIIKHNKYDTYFGVVLIFLTQKFTAVFIDTHTHIFIFFSIPSTSACTSACTTRTTCASSTSYGFTLCCCSSTT